MVSEAYRINTTKDMDRQLFPLHLLHIVAIRQEDIVLNVVRQDKILEQDFVHHVVNHTINNCTQCSRLMR